MSSPETTSQDGRQWTITADDHGDVDALFAALRDMGIGATKEHAVEDERGRRRRDDIRVKSL
jgi:hypothetical protein